MNLTLIIVVLSFFFLFGCVTNEVQIDSNFISSQEDNNLNENVFVEGVVEEKYPFTTENFMSIIFTDVDYADFNLFYPEFEPDLKSYIHFSKSDYLKLREVWIVDDAKKVFIPIVDKLELTENTYFVEFVGKVNINTGLIAIVDIKTNESLKIISVMKMNVGA